MTNRYNSMYRRTILDNRMVSANKLNWLIYIYINVRENQYFVNAYE